MGPSVRTAIRLGRLTVGRGAAVLELLAGPPQGGMERRRLVYLVDEPRRGPGRRHRLSSRRPSGWAWLRQQGLHEALGLGVIVGIASSPHRTDKTGAKQGVPIGQSGILGGFKRSSQRDILFYARHRSRASAGVAHSRVFRGRALRVAAMAASVSALCTLRSVPFGKYWRSSPLVFSLEPRCQGLLVLLTPRDHSKRVVAIRAGSSA